MANSHQLVPTAQPPAPTPPTAHAAGIVVNGVNVFYGAKQALLDVSMEMRAGEVTAFIGPSGCGKTTLLRALNRMIETIPHARVTGAIRVGGKNVYDADIDPVHVRRLFGVVAQKPNPFPSSVYDNVAYGARIQGLAQNRAETDVVVEQSLRRAGLWEEVKDRLQEPGTDLSGGQQQRLCIARAIAPQPRVLLMDEPCSALDPIATTHVEALIDEIRGDYTTVIVTHNMQQAARVAQRTAFFYLGRMVEAGDTAQIFTAPRETLTAAFVAGRYG